MKSTTGIILQARTGSTRLPEKVIRPFRGAASILDILLEKLKTAPYPLVLATTDNPSDDRLAEVARRHGVDFFRGSENNVLERFVQAALRHGFDFVIRVCADNPFLSLPLLRGLMEEAEKLRFDFDYLSYSYQGTPAILTHFGVFVELVRTAALERALAQTGEQVFLEHVTNYIYRHPDRFRVVFRNLPPDTFASPAMRLTVDTEEDFALAARLYRELEETAGSTELEAVNGFLREKPEMLEKMAEQRLKNLK